MKATKWTRTRTRHYITRLSDLKQDKEGRFQLPNGDLATLFFFNIELGSATAPCLFRPILEWNAVIGRTRYTIVNDGGRGERA